MADEKMSEAITYEDADATILVAGSPVLIELAMDAGADAKAGQLVYQSAAATFGVSGDVVQNLGVLLEDPTYDIDTDFIETQAGRIARLGSGCICRSFVSDHMGTGVSISAGMIAQHCATNDGEWTVTSISSGVTTADDITFVQLNHLVGRCGKFITIVEDAGSKIGWLMLSV